MKRKRDCFERETDIIFITNESPTDSYRYVEIKEGRLSLVTPNCYQDGGRLVTGESINRFSTI